jgi:hypothetical protein
MVGPVPRNLSRPCPYSASRWPTTLPVIGTSSDAPVKKWQDEEQAGWGRSRFSRLCARDGCVWARGSHRCRRHPAVRRRGGGLRGRRQREGRDPPGRTRSGIRLLTREDRPRSRSERDPCDPSRRALLPRTPAAPGRRRRTSAGVAASHGVARGVLRGRRVDDGPARAQQAAGDPVAVQLELAAHEPD